MPSSSSSRRRCWRRNRPPLRNAKPPAAIISLQTPVTPRSLRQQVHISQVRIELTPSQFATRDIIRNLAIENIHHGHHPPPQPHQHHHSRSGRLQTISEPSQLSRRPANRHKGLISLCRHENGKTNPPLPSASFSPPPPTSTNTNNRAAPALRGRAPQVGISAGARQGVPGDGRPRWATGHREVETAHGSHGEVHRVGCEHDDSHFCVFGKFWGGYV